MARFPLKLYLTQEGQAVVVTYDAGPDQCGVRSEPMFAGDVQGHVESIIRRWVDGRYACDGVELI